MLSAVGTSPPSRTPIVALPVSLLVNLIVLWFAVHFVVEALDGLLEVKFATYESR